MQSQQSDLITIALSAEKWNQVLALLAEGPFRIAAPLITEIREQAMAQQKINGGTALQGAQEGAYVSD